MTRLRDRRGFTLVELLVSMMLALVVIGGAFALVSAGERSSKRIQDRVDSSRRGRVAMEQISQQLRAMACLPPVGAVGFTSPIVAATNDQITFQTNIVDPDRLDPTKLALSGTNTAAAQTAAFNADRRRLTVVRDGAGLPTAIREERNYDPATQAYGRSRVVISPVQQSRRRPADPLEPVFQFYPYTPDPDPAAAPAPLAAPGPAGLSAADIVRVAQIRVAFRARPSDPSRDRLSSVDFQGSVYARTFETGTSGTASQPVPGAQPTFERTFRCQ